MYNGARSPTHPAVRRKQPPEPSKDLQHSSAGENSASSHARQELYGVLVRLAGTLRYPQTSSFAPGCRIQSPRNPTGGCQSVPFHFGNRLSHQKPLAGKTYYSQSDYALLRVRTAYPDRYSPQPNRTLPETTQGAPATRKAQLRHRHRSLLGRYNSPTGVRPSPLPQLRLHP